MRDVKVGSVWVNNINIHDRVEVYKVENGEVYGVSSMRGDIRSSKAFFNSDYRPVKSELPTQSIKVGSVWLGREDGDLVYVESTDGSIWNINFNSLDDEHEYANDTEGFLKQYSFVSDSKDDDCLAFNTDRMNGSVAIKELWKAKCDGTVCEVVDIEVDDGVTWIVTENEDAVEADTLADFFKSYEFFSSEKPKPVSASANAILATASDMLGERGKQYDTNGEERSMAKIVASFNAKTGRDLTELEGWLFMTDLKAVRALAGGSMDCFVDGAAYFALAGESVGEK